MSQASELYGRNSIVGSIIDENFGKYSISIKVGAYCKFNSQQVSNQLHYHSCYELCIVTKGTGLFMVGGCQHDVMPDTSSDVVKQSSVPLTPVKVNKGDIFVAVPNVLHEVRALEYEQLELIYFFIDFDKLSGNNNNTNCKWKEDEIIKAFLGDHKTFSAKNNHLLAYLRFIEEYHSGKNHALGYGSYQAIKNLIIESLSALTNKKFFAQSDNVILNNTLESALDYIDRELNNHIMVKEIAKECSTSVRNLELIFRKHLNKTVKQYINEKKVKLAAHYLTMLYSVNKAAEMIGINDVAQFSRLFNKYEGVSPKKYQQIHAPRGKEFGRRIV